MGPDMRGRRNRVGCRDAESEIHAKGRWPCEHGDTNGSECVYKSRIPGINCLQPPGVR